MSKELAISQPGGPEAVEAGSRGVVLSKMEDMLEMARMVASSGLAPATLKSPEAILIAMQHGMEIGLAPMQAIQSIAVINNRPSIWGDAALALAMAHPDFEDINETFERGATAEDMLAKCEVKRKGRSPVIRTFSVGDAKKAKLWEKAGPWQQYPKRMLAMRARSFAIRDSFPDALKGVAIVEEMRDVTPREPRQPMKAIVMPDEGPAPEQPTLPAPESTAEPTPPDTGLADRDLF